jgi:uncharacterized Fe-S center protein
MFRELDSGVGASALAVGASALAGESDQHACVKIVRTTFKCRRKVVIATCNCTSILEYRPAFE